MTLGSEIAAGATLGGNQYQQSLAINPLNTKQIAVVMKTAFITEADALICTRDGGATWNSFAFGGSSDPCCTYDQLGNLHVFAINSNHSTPTAYYRSTDGGATLAAPVALGTTGGDSVRCWVDRTSGTFANSVYMTQTQFFGNMTELYYSRDAGVTWNLTVLDTSGIVPSGQAGSLGGGSQAEGTVLPDGKLVWSATNAQTIASSTSFRELYSLSSPNGGVTINVVDVGPFTIPFSGTSGYYGTTAGNTANLGNTVYFTYTQPQGSLPAVLKMYKSTDEGATWAAPVTILTPSAGFDVCSMWMGTNADGVIGISYYECNSAVTFFNIKFIYSLDGGTTWSAPLLVSSAPSNYLGNPQIRTPGQDNVYGSVDGAGNFWIVWQDARGSATQYTTYIRKVTFS